MITRILAVLAVACGAWTAPALAGPPLIPFHTNYTYWDHHWIQWLPDHPRYEAIEAAIASDPADGGRRLLRVWFTERALPKAQTYFFSDEAAATAQRGRSYHRPMEWIQSGASAMPQALDLRFADDSGRTVRWRLAFDSGARLTDEWSGLKPQGGHAADAVFLLWHIGPNATTTDSAVEIDGQRHTATPDQVARAGLFYGAAYAQGVHAGVFNYGSARVTPGNDRVMTDWAGRSYVAERPDAMRYRSQAFGFGQAGQIELETDATGGLAAYRHAFGAHAMRIAFDPPIALAGDGASIHAYSVAFDGAAAVLRGDAHAARSGSDLELTWQPEKPAWARSTPLRTSLAGAVTVGDYRLTVTRAGSLRP